MSNKFGKINSKLHDISEELTDLTVDLKTLSSHEVVNSDTIELLVEVIDNKIQVIREVIGDKKRISNELDKILYSKSFLEIAEGVKFRDTFNPTGEDYMKYKDMKFKVIRELIPNKEYDKTSTNHRMYEIQLDNGKKIHAFENEVEIDYLDELYKLTLIETERALNEEERTLYLELVDFCKNNNIKIDFGINI